MLDAIVGGLFNLGATRMQNLASAKQAHKQMEFQLNMSNTAHQREVADLRAAGLNPILSGTGGAGASTASGAMAPVSSYAGGFSAYQEARAKRQEWERQKLQTQTDEYVRDRAGHEATTAEYEKNIAAADWWRESWKQNDWRRENAAWLKELEARAHGLHSSARSAAVTAEIDEKEKDAESIRRWVRPFAEGASAFGNLGLKVPRGAGRDMGRGRSGGPVRGGGIRRGR